MATFPVLHNMRIDRMIEGNLYEIKPQTILEEDHVPSLSPAAEFPVLRGWRKWQSAEIRPPFIYLGWKMEDWTYAYRCTNKIHYVLWQEDIYVMDNQFAKHVVPVWEKGEEDG